MIRSSISNRATAGCRAVAAAILAMGLLALGAGTALADRELHFVNRTGQTIWVGGSNASGLTGEITGFVLDPGGEKTITVDGEDLTSASFWPRLGCSEKDGKFECTMGDCGSAVYGYDLQCNGGTKSAPANNVELNLSGAPGVDFYDLSNVDGLVLGISVEPYGDYKKVPGVAAAYNCTRAACQDFDMQKCPPELSYTDEYGNQSCFSICQAIYFKDLRDQHQVLQDIFNDEDQRDLVCCACGDCGNPSHGYENGCKACCCCDSRSKYCCSPYIEIPDLCPDLPHPDLHGGICHVEDWPRPDAEWCKRAGVSVEDCRYDRIFKSQCKDAYSWQFNDGSSTYQCQGANYKIVFWVD